MRADCPCQRCDAASVDSIISADNYPHRAAQTGSRAITIPKDAVGGPKEASGQSVDQSRFSQIRQTLSTRLRSTKELRRLSKNVRLTETREGLRIEGVADREPYIPKNRMTRVTGGCRLHWAGRVLCNDLREIPC